MFSKFAQAQNGDAAFDLAAEVRRRRGGEVPGAPGAVRGVRERGAADEGTDCERPLLFCLRCLRYVFTFQFLFF